MRTWQLQTAKAQLSEVLRRAKTEGPQEITVRGKDAFVLLTREEFERGRPFGGAADGEALFAALQKSPLRGVDLENLRENSPLREIEL